jgi:hypothetical protein
MILDQLSRWPRVPLKVFIVVSQLYHSLEQTVIRAKRLFFFRFLRCVHSVHSLQDSLHERLKTCHE